jgi:biotin operon repressor
LTQEMSVVQLAKKLGCSDNAIHKRMSKLGLK